MTTHPFTPGGIHPYGADVIPPATVCATCGAGRPAHDQPTVLGPAISATLHRAATSLREQA